MGKRRRRSPWIDKSYQQLLTQWLKQWSKHQKTLLNQITPLSPINKISPPAHLQQKSYLSISRAYKDKDIKSIKSLLHGTLRAEMRIGMNATTKKLDNLRASHELGNLIKILTYRPQSTVHTLLCSTRGQITDHYEIHRQLNGYFREWHAI
jgi:hypothetical protein